MPDFRIKRGFDIGLSGSPRQDVDDRVSSRQVALYPLEFLGVKQRLIVREGDTVKCGTPLIENKRNENLKLCAPASGVVKSIILGARRFVEQIVIEVGEDRESDQFSKHTVDDIAGLDRTEVLQNLERTGYLGFIRQRPFSGIADVTASPKAIYVNGMNTAPFRADAGVVVADDPEGFQAGINVLTCVTDGEVHLCMAANSHDALKSTRNAQIHTFTGPHPSGNTSVHIARIDPISPTDIVWTVKAVDLVLIGRLFLDGTLPDTRIIALGGPGVVAEAQQHFRVRIGGALSDVLADSFVPGENRVISGDALSGTRIEADGHFRLFDSSLTVLPEGRERRFLGWTMPGLDQFSFSRTVASSWLGRKKNWRLNTSSNGEQRTMVLTGYYDRVMPLNIMVDYLVRAVLANDTDEAIKLGILETDPEDFALCDFICPSKTEVQAIIRQGLDAIEEEGI